VLRVKASSDDTSASAASGDELVDDLKAKVQRSWHQRGLRAASRVK
jgi:hypothetical protein